MTHRTRQPGFTIGELLAVLAAITVLLAVSVPVIGRVGGDSGVQASMNNLATLGMAHVLYALDWDGRQVTWSVDDLATYGSVANYNSVNGCTGPFNGCHPGIVWGYGINSSLYGYWMNNSGHHWAVAPINFTGAAQYFGQFRFPNVNPFHNYVGGRVYDPTFFAPNDTIVIETAAPLFDLPMEFNELANPPVWSSYCMSPAAMFGPGVMRANADGGFQDPWSIDDGFTSPGLFQATYPNLKTLMIEHSWVQNAPTEPALPSLPHPSCNPAFDPDLSVYACEPYYFNHGAASEPVTLFYDGSVRLLPNAEVFAGDQQVLDQTKGVDGLWHRGTPFGPQGYLIDFGLDGQVSHHVLTTDGILGRDTLGPMEGKRLAAPPATSWPASLSRKRAAPAPSFLDNISYLVTPEEQP